LSYSAGAISSVGHLRNRGRNLGGRPLKVVTPKTRAFDDPENIDELSSEEKVCRRQGRKRIAAP